MLERSSAAPSELDALVARFGLVDPTDASVHLHPAAPRLAALAGVRIGLLDNRKPNAAQLLDELGRLMRDRFAVGTTKARSKFIYSLPAAPDIIDELASCDAVVTAIGD